MVDLQKYLKIKNKKSLTYFLPKNEYPAVVSAVSRNLSCINVRTGIQPLAPDQNRVSLESDTQFCRIKGAMVNNFQKA